MDRQEKNREPRYLTVWVMKNMTAEPVQYRVKVRSLKAAAWVALCFVVILPLALVGSGMRCSSLSRQKEQLARVASRYQVSSAKLEALAGRVQAVEEKMSMSGQRTQKLILGMENDLRQWLPQGAVGGGEESGHSAIKDSARASLFSRSQIKEVKNIQLRLARLDKRIDSYDLTIKDLEDAWKDRNSIFAVFPSIWPVPRGHITSGFGVRVHPISHRLQKHEGIDIADAPGTPIYAAAPGVVIFAGRKNGYGKCLEVDHGYGLSTFYAHCRKLHVRRGQKVARGQEIGEVGSTGDATGPHLHFEVRVNENKVDPMEYLSIFSPGPNFVAQSPADSLGSTPAGTKQNKRRLR